MYVNDLRVTDYDGTTKPPTYYVAINSYHVTIRNSDNEVVWNRKPENDDWLDEPHNKLTEALSKLENALKEVVKS